MCGAGEMVIILGWLKKASLRSFKNYKMRIEPDIQKNVLSKELQIQRF